MMTGKYMRPLLALGLGEDSETWAAHLRRYGYRTAAFYPPAVFFIDADRFASFEASGLDFEYAKVEFADPALREAQVDDVPRGGADRQAALPLGAPLRAARAVRRRTRSTPSGGRRPTSTLRQRESPTADDGDRAHRRARARARGRGAVVIVTADHGEEFGEHGGRYHGTTVYEEQVRVPLVVVGPGRRARARVDDGRADDRSAADGALGARHSAAGARARARSRAAARRGRGDAPDDPGSRSPRPTSTRSLARGDDRLVCARRAAACALYDRATTRASSTTVAAKRATAVARAAARCSAAIERDTGGTRAAAGRVARSAAARAAGRRRRGRDVAALLDDANVGDPAQGGRGVLRAAAPADAPELRRALARDEDDEVRRWAALALVRMGERRRRWPSASARSASPEWRRRAALAFAERGDGRGRARSWRPGGRDVRAGARRGCRGEPPRLALDSRDIAGNPVGRRPALKCRTAVPALLRALD